MPSSSPPRDVPWLARCAFFGGLTGIKSHADAPVRDHSSELTLEPHLEHPPELPRHVEP